MSQFSLLSLSQPSNNSTLTLSNSFSPTHESSIGSDTPIDYSQVGTPKSLILMQESMTNCYMDFQISATLDELSETTEKIPELVKEEKDSPDASMAIKDHGYSNVQKIDTTSQGCIFTAKTQSGKLVVIKSANKYLHKNSLKICDNQKIFCYHNIIKEKNLLKLLESFNPPPGFVKPIDFFYDEKNIFLVQDHGGISLFEHVKKSHEKIKNGSLPIKEWQNHSRILIAQGLRYLSWLHNHVYVCHLDISLENMTIKGVQFNQEKKKYTNHGQIHFVDFGLSDIFSPTTNFKCKKFVGKTSYNSPNIYAKKEFDARKADVWSFGVCIFMIICGFPPYEKPIMTDSYFNILWKGRMKSALKKWGLYDKFPRTANDLIKKIFTTEENRITINEMMAHQYIQKTISFLESTEKVSFKYENKGKLDFDSKKLNLFKGNAGFDDIHKPKMKGKEKKPRKSQSDKLYEISASNTIYQPRIELEENGMPKNNPIVKDRAVSVVDMNSQRKKCHQRNQTGRFVKKKGWKK